MTFQSLDDVNTKREFLDQLEKKGWSHWSATLVRTHPLEIGDRLDVAHERAHLGARFQVPYGGAAVVLSAGNVSSRGIETRE